MQAKQLASPFHRECSILQASELERTISELRQLRDELMQVNADLEEDMMYEVE